MFLTTLFVQAYRWFELMNQPALYPVYGVLMVGTVLVWVVTTPLRNVGCVMLTSFFQLVMKHAKIMTSIMEEYLLLVKNDRLQALSPSEYLWTLYEAIFTVPREVIACGEEEYGLYGILACKWLVLVCLFAQHVAVAMGLIVPIRAW